MHCCVCSVSAAKKALCSSGIEASLLPNINVGGYTAVSAAICRKKRLCVPLVLRAQRTTICEPGSLHINVWGCIAVSVVILLQTRHCVSAVGFIVAKYRRWGTHCLRSKPATRKDFVSLWCRGLTVAEYQRWGIQCLRSKYAAR